MLPSNGEHLAATIVDISKSGLRLELGSTLLKGSRVEITTSPRKLIIFGEVRYCRRVGGIFNAGILIEGVVAPAGDSEAHLLDDEIALFVIGKGLAVPEVLRAKDHISQCDACSRRMVDTPRLFIRDDRSPRLVNRLLWAPAAQFGTGRE